MMGAIALSGSARPFELDKRARTCASSRTGAGLAIQAGVRVAPRRSTPLATASNTRKRRVGNRTWSAVFPTSRLELLRSPRGERIEDERWPWLLGEVEVVREVAEDRCPFADVGARVWSAV